MERKPPQYGQIVFNIKNIQDTFREVNLKTQSPFMPSLPEGLFRAEALGSSDKRPLRVLSLGKLRLSIFSNHKITNTLQTVEVCAASLLSSF